MPAARRLHPQRGARAHAHGQAPPARRRLYAACTDAAQAWGPPWRVVRKANGLSAGAPPRLVVTSLAAPTPPMRSEALAGARGHGAHEIKAVHVDRHRARTAATPCLANARRLGLTCAAAALPPALRPPPTNPPRWRRPRPRRCSSPAAPSLPRGNRTRTAGCSTSPGPALSKRSDSG
jgi:hypothetical protein